MSDDPIPAATLIVVREPAEGPPEILMVERAAGMAFAGGAMVFPGGRIDDSDRALAPDSDGAARIAAIRETIEETGVPVGLDPAPERAVAHALQDALAADSDFGSLIKAAKLRLDPAALTPFSRWIPKFHASRRFDTIFFLARAPAGAWEPRIFDGECAGAAWFTAQDVLDRDRAGEARLIFPTRRNLERLAQHASFDSMVSDAQSHALVPITPWVEERGGERFVTIPSGIGYPITQEPLEGLWRG